MITATAMPVKQNPLPSCEPPVYSDIAGLQMFTLCC